MELVKRKAPQATTISAEEFKEALNNGEGIPSLSNGTSLKEGEIGTAILSADTFQKLEGESINGTPYKLFLTEATVTIGEGENAGKVRSGEMMSFHKTDFEAMDFLGFDLSDEDTWGAELPVECAKIPSGSLVVRINKSAFLEMRKAALESESAAAKKKRLAINA